MQNRVFQTAKLEKCFGKKVLYATHLFRRICNVVPRELKRPFSNKAPKINKKKPSAMYSCSLQSWIRLLFCMLGNLKLTGLLIPRYLDLNIISGSIYKFYIFANLTLLFPKIKHRSMYSRHNWLQDLKVRPFHGKEWLLVISCSALHIISCIWYRRSNRIRLIGIVIFWLDYNSISFFV